MRESLERIFGGDEHKSKKNKIQARFYWGGHMKPSVDLNLKFKPLNQSGASRGFKPYLRHKTLFFLNPTFSDCLFKLLKQIW